MVYQIVSLLMTGVNSCLSWFSQVCVNTGMWILYLSMFIVVCIGSLVAPFCYKVGSGFSDRAKERQAVDKYGNKVKPSNDEKWLM